MELPSEDPVSPTRGLEGLKTALEAEALDEFPMDRSNIDYSFGDIELEDGRGGWVPVRNLTDYLHRDSYDTPFEVFQALQLALDEYRQNRTAA